jgi:hypothetical protein
VTRRWLQQLLQNTTVAGIWAEELLMPAACEEEGLTQASTTSWGYERMNEACACTFVICGSCIAHSAVLVLVGKVML